MHRAARLPSRAAAGNAIGTPARPRVPAPASPDSAALRPSVRAAAAGKKGGGKKGSAQKKGGGALAGLLKKKDEAAAAGAGAAADGGDGSNGRAAPVQYRDPDVLVQLMMITAAYKKQYGEYLIEAAFDQLADAMYRAPFVCLAHETADSDDPLFTYANRAALEMFETTWDEFIGLPSRLSADEASQQDRNAVLKKAAEQGSVKEEGVWRVSRKGTRFQLKDVRLFNVAELDGTPWGQAAVIRQYALEDGTVITPRGEQPPPSSLDAPPSAEDVAAAEAAVAEQAAAVRSLKEQQGLSNTNEAVVDAVSELLARKADLEELQERYKAALRETEAAAKAPPTLESSGDE